MSLSLTATYIQVFCLNPWSSWPFQAFPANQFTTWTLKQIQEARAAWGLFESIDALDADVRLLRAGETFAPETGVNDPSIWTDLLIESVYDQYNYGQYLHTLVSPEIDWTSQRHLGFPPAGTRYLTLRLLVPYPISVTNPLAIPQHKSAIVLWPQPTIPVVKYTVTSNPDAITSVVTPPSLSTVITGLTDGSAYTFSIVSTDALNLSSPPAITAPVIPRTNPGRPSQPTVTAKVRALLVQWTAPVNDGANGRGGPLIYTITSDTVRADFVSIYIETSATILDISGLKGGFEYSFTVVATNIFGLESEPSIRSIKVATLAPPDPPTNVVGVGIDSGAQITWNPPENIGGSPIVSYTITVVPGNYVLTVPGPSATFPGLVNGIAFTCTVVATNNLGTSSPSVPSQTFIPARPPSAPIVTAIPGDKIVTLSWRTADPGGFPVVLYKHYQITPNPTTPIISISDRTAVYRNLTNGTAYSYGVISTNRMGDSAVTMTIPVIPGTVAGVPTAVVAVPGVRQAFMSWTAPVYNGFAAIQSYTVLFTTGPQIFTTNIVGPNISQIVTALANGTTYSFTVIANNYFGASLPSTAVICHIPDIPRPVSFTASYTSMTVALAWTAPFTDVGFPITTYKIFATPGPSEYLVSGTSTSTSITSLTNGTPYTFWISAINAVGPSLQTSTITITPSTIPDAPVVAAVTGNNAATITWTAPYNGGAPITSYTVTYTDISGIQNVPFYGLIAQIYSLINGTTYTFSVTANNKNGRSIPGVATILVATVPGLPTDVAITTGISRTATIRWNPPLNTGGPVISSYTVTCSDTTQIPKTVMVPSATFSTLTNGATYTFSVTANNIMGPSLPVSATALIGTEPTPPRNIYVVPGNQRAVVTWDIPTNNNGGVIQSYNVSCPASAQSSQTISVPNLLTATFTGLVNGTSYVFFVYAMNQFGVSSPVQSASILVGIPPDQPTNVQVVVNTQGYAIITWIPPVNTGNLPLLAYTVNCSDLTRGTKAPTSASATYINLSWGTYYSFSIVANNQLGASGTVWSDLTLIGVAPYAPINLTISVPAPQPYTQNNTAIANIAWNPPNNNGGANITSYTATCSLNSQTITTFDTNAAFTNIPYGNATFYVFATNVFGNSPPAFNPTPVPVGTVPDAPQSVVVSAGVSSRQATITWSDSNKTGGAPITQHIVSCSDLTISPQASSGSSVTFTTLTDGLSYTFYVSAVNQFGASAAGISALTKIGRKPDVPIQPVGAVSYQQQTVNINGASTNAITVSWITPNFYGNEIESYTVSCPLLGQTLRVNGTETSTSFVNVFFAGNPIYSFNIFATNYFGNSNVLTIKGSLPGAPINLKVDTGVSSSATVSWDKPDQSVTSYIITYYLNYSGTLIQVGTTISTIPYVKYPMSVIDSGTTRNSYTYSNMLTNGSYYVFSVAAKNTFGTGPAAITENFLVGCPPSVPGSLTTTFRQNQKFLLNSSNVSVASIDISWNAVIAPFDGGQAVSTYTITAVADNGTTGTLPDTHTVSNGVCSMKGILATGYVYTLTVAATNGFGTSGSSEPVTTAKVVSVPQAPFGLTASMPTTAQSAYIVWTLPNEGGTPITSYAYTYNGTVVTANVLSAPESDKRAAQFTNLVWSKVTDNTFTVTPTNACGTGLAGTITGVTVYATVQPGDFTVTPTAEVMPNTTNVGIKLSWTAAAQGTGPPVTYSAKIGTNTPTIVGQTAELYGLEFNTDYEYSVTASNNTALVRKKPTTTSTQKTFGPPAAPSSVSAAVVTNADVNTKLKVRVTWETVSSATMYKITAIKSGSGSTAIFVEETTSSPYDLDISGQIGTYNILVNATNKYGYGPSKAITDVACYYNVVPDKITDFTATLTTTNDLTVSFTIPGGKGPPVVSNVTLADNTDTISIQGISTDDTTTGVSFTTPNLIAVGSNLTTTRSLFLSEFPGRTFSITVTARNSVGPSIASNAITVTVPESVAPAAPVVTRVEYMYYRTVNYSDGYGGSYDTAAYLRIDWETSSNTTGYKLFRTSDNILYNTTSTFITISLGRVAPFGTNFDDVYKSYSYNLYAMNGTGLSTGVEISNTFQSRSGKAGTSIPANITVIYSNLFTSNDVNALILTGPFVPPVPAAPVVTSIEYSYSTTVQNQYTTMIYSYLRIGWATSSNITEYKLVNKLVPTNNIYHISSTSNFITIVVGSSQQSAPTDYYYDYSLDFYAVNGTSVSASTPISKYFTYRSSTAGYSTPTNVTPTYNRATGYINTTSGTAT